AAVVDHDHVGLAVGGPQAASEHLAIQTHSARWPRQHDATNIGAVKTFGQDRAVGHHVDHAAAELFQDRVALVLQRRAVDVGGLHAGPDELIPDVDRVLHPRRELHASAPLLAAI